MRRALSLFLAAFPLDLARRALPASGEALVLAHTAGGRELVLRCCARAARAGVRPGMSTGEARALCGHGRVRVVPADPLRETAELERLGRFATRFSPVVALDPPEGLLLDVAGCERLFGGEHALARALARALEGLGFDARLAVAGTIGCAWALARFGREPLALVPPGGERAALAPLPVESLRLDERAAAALLEVGAERVGHLFALERAELAARFGAPLLERLDQALGRRVETVEPLRPAPPPRVERFFAGPVADLEPLVLTVRALIGALCDELARRDEGARRVDLELAPTDLEPLCVPVRLSRPTRDRAHLFALLEPLVERARVGTGVERVTLVARSTAPMRPAQIEPWADAWLAGARAQRGRAELDRAAGELVDALVGRFGDGRIRRVEPVESHVPERAFRTRPLAAPDEPRARRADVSATSERPSLLFAEPERMRALACRLPAVSQAGVSEARLSAGAPGALAWRGRELRVVASRGPERIAAPWWERDASELGREQPVRDYYRVLTACGRRLWIFCRAPEGAWLVHGEWV